MIFLSFTLFFNMKMQYVLCISFSLLELPFIKLFFNGISLQILKTANIWSEEAV